MKKIIIATGFLLPFICHSAQKELDYCAKTEAWAAQKTIGILVGQNPELYAEGASSSLVMRTKLTENKEPITLGEWGQLYNQITKVTIPYKDKKKPPVIIITSSIISSVECSLSEPSYVELMAN